MGARTRCPVCNRFGQSELGGLCRACDLKKFEKEVLKVSHGSNRVIVSVLNEFKAKNYGDISVDDRRIFLNMIKRRMPGKRGGYIAQPNSRLERYGYSHPGYSKQPGIIKEVADIVME